MSEHTEEDRGPTIRLYLEPERPIEVSALTAALGSLSRQYQLFAVQNGLSERQADAKLLVSNVAPGSIDINLIPDWHAILATMPPLVPILHDRVELVLSFAKKIKKILDFFLEGPGQESSPIIGAKDCDDAKNIVAPIAHSGGRQTISVTNNHIEKAVFVTTASDARDVFERANEFKRLLAPAALSDTKRERVAMVWSQLARDSAKTSAKRSPDRGLIAEIDPKPHAVFFTEDTAHLKREMIDDVDNPYQQVFFVDVEISIVPDGSVGNYRITAFYGKESLEPSSSEETP